MLAFYRRNKIPGLINQIPIQSLLFKISVNNRQSLIKTGSITLYTLRIYIQLLQAKYLQNTIKSSRKNQSSHTDNTQKRKNRIVAHSKTL